MQCLIRCKTDTLVHRHFFFSLSIYFSVNTKILMMKCERICQFCKYHIYGLIMQSLNPAGIHDFGFGVYKIWIFFKWRNTKVTKMALYLKFSFSRSFYCVKIALICPQKNPYTYTIGLGHEPLQWSMIRITTFNIFWTTLFYKNEPNFCQLGIPSFHKASNWSLWGKNMSNLMKYW